MNPWKIVGWMVVAIMGLMLYTCVRTAANMGNAAQADSYRSPPAANSFQTPAPSYSVTVVSVECSGRGRDKADITVRNTGSTAIPYAKAFAQFTDKAGSVVSAKDSYFSPSTIPPGATASADVYSNGSGAHRCALTGIQDGDGNSVALQ